MSSRARGRPGRRWVPCSDEEDIDYFGFGDGAATSTPCPCGNDGTPWRGQGCVNSTTTATSSGVGGQLIVHGTDSIVADDLELDAHNIQPSQFALLFAGPNRINFGMGVPFRDGLRCVGGGITRLGVAVAGGSHDDFGVASWGPGLAAIHGWSPGPLHFQAWYRDPAGPCGTASNFTNAATVNLTP